MPQNRKNSPPSIAVVYHMFPHYRMPIMRELSNSQKYRFLFYGDQRIFYGIKPADNSMPNLAHMPFFKIYRIYFQPSVLRIATARKYDAIIFLSNPNFLTTWIAAALARVVGTKVLFWGHGWLRPEGWLRRTLRSAFYRLSHMQLVYSQRGRSLGIKQGFPSERIHVVYNSLDLAVQNSVFSSLEIGEELFTENPRKYFTNPELPLIICTARLTSACRFDLLLEAASYLALDGQPINILLVGEGPELSRLKQLATKLDTEVIFWGACYDEHALGPLIYHADITVSPGKVGLTAIHSMAYGTPVISHDDLNAQMPEVETIVPGKTGLLFRRGDAKALSQSISTWFSIAADRATVRQDCRSTILGTWSPENQRDLIEAALDEVLGNAAK